ncbi:restriction endonuclease subunit S [Nostoc sp.]|uniref:restriction endonuclease subunit S n=1 Tax=Nostoc sp. TaxID=1180 RepID=UPI002FF91D83
MSKTLVKSETFNNTPIGNFPLDWDIVTIGDIATYVGSGITPKGGSNIYKKEGILFIRSQNVTFEGLLLDDVAHIDKKIHKIMKRSEVFAHDVLLNITGASIGRCCPLPEGLGTANVNQHVCAIRLPNPNRENAIFLSSVLASYIGESQINKLNAGGNREGLNYQQLRAFLIPFPPTQERADIAKILDAIDKAIALTDTHITKLKKAKAGLLHDLLTRGIDEHGELRDPTRNPEQFKRSPLGIIPKDWGVQPAENICLAVVDCKNRTPPVTDEGHPVIRTTNIRNGNFIYKDLQFTDHRSYLQWTRKGIPRYGDVLITREAPVGEVCLLPEHMTHACLGQRMMMYQVNPDIIGNDFMLLSLLSDSVKSRLLDLAGGSTVGHVRVGDIRRQLVHVPPLYEQVRIVECLKPLSQKLSVKVNILNKLKLLKKGLMLDLLTGQVRVKI